MIEIGIPYVTVEGADARLRARVSISDDTARAYIERTEELTVTAWHANVDYPPASWGEDGGELWFSVPAEFGKYLCFERSNAFVIALLWYAMITKSDIRFQAPLSQRLYNGIVNRLMPALEQNGFAPIRLDGPTTCEPAWCEGAVATGMSCGVDSYYTLQQYRTDDAPGGLKLTHLTYYDNDYLFPRGYAPDDLQALYRKADQHMARVVAGAHEIADHNNLPLVVVCKNLDRDYYRGGLSLTGMYRHFSCTLALEHLYSTYISSSSGHEDNVFEVSLTSPTQHYEGLLCDALRTETLHYAMSDHDSRVHKLQQICDDADFQKYAEVCFNHDILDANCGECYGCWKTMVILDLLGKLDGFRESFDVDKYHANRREVFESFVRFSMRPEASSARESVRQILELAKDGDTSACREFETAYRTVAGEGNAPS